MRKRFYFSFFPLSPSLRSSAGASIGLFFLPPFRPASAPRQALVEGHRSRGIFFFSPLGTGELAADRVLEVRRVSPLRGSQLCLRDSAFFLILFFFLFLFCSQSAREVGVEASRSFSFPFFLALRGWRQLRFASMVMPKFSPPPPSPPSLPRSW